MRIRERMGASTQVCHQQCCRITRFTTNKAHNKKQNAFLLFSAPRIMPLVSLLMEQSPRISMILNKSKKPNWHDPASSKEQKVKTKSKEKSSETEKMTIMNQEVKTLRSDNGRL